MPVIAQEIKTRHDMTLLDSNLDSGCMPAQIEPQNAEFLKGSALVTCNSQDGHKHK